MLKGMQYDVFISHASEDKEGFVRDLAHALAEQRLNVWFDEFTLNVGDSVRRSIDEGLKNSKFGIVVLSPSFFSKRWTEWELDGLVIRHLQNGGNVVLPIWHDVDHNAVTSFSPPLANVMAIPSSVGVSEVVKRLLKVIRPEGSSLGIARELALSTGLDVPVETDDYWLDVLQWASSNYEDYCDWTFPLPADGLTPQERGCRLGWAAIQWNWTYDATEQRLHILTPPWEIIEFIESQPGLSETCRAYPEVLATHAPLLTIPGLSGPFEECFDEAMARSVSEYAKQNRDTCDRRWALRHDRFGNRTEYDVMHFLAYTGISVHLIDIAVWLLSSASEWLPSSHRSFLLQGVKEYGRWAFWSHSMAFYSYDGDHFFDSKEELNYLGPVPSELPNGMRAELEKRIDRSAKELGLPEDSDTMTRRFLDEGFIVALFEVEKRKHESRQARIGASTPPKALD